MIRFIVFVLVVGFVAGGHQNGKNLTGNEVDNKLVGICQGHRIQLKKIPFMASLKVNGMLFGAAVVLNNWWMVTSAFNLKWFDPSQLEIRVKSPQQGKGGQILTADQVVCHESYDGGWDYNICLVKSNQEIKVKAVTRGEGELQAGTEVTTAGWGSSEYSSEPSQFLLSAGLTVMDLKLCNETYSPFYLTSRLICTKHEDKDSGPCGEGDSGDPMIYKNVMYGLFSGKLYDTSPKLYTNITAYADWIDSIINS